jgi:hypothetical protein
MQTKDSQVRNQALNHFRHLVALLYREIGVLQPRHHETIAAKAKLSGGFFGPNRKERALQLYRLTRAETDSRRILDPYSNQTGLKLDDLLEAFAYGRWQNRAGQFSFGGPRWAQIADFAIRLREVIERESWAQVPHLLAEVVKLNHNSGRIVDKYSQLDV